MQSSKAELQAWLERWKRVNEFEVQELRDTSVETKLRQLAALMASAEAFGWREDQEEIEEVRARWNRLREIYRERS
jgi:hypothetical protein